MPSLTLEFPDDATKEQFERWWSYAGKASCHRFIERTLARKSEPFLSSGVDDAPDPLRFWWDDIPF